MALVCGADAPLADTGTAVDLLVDPVAPGTECEVTYPAEHVCEMAVTAAGLEGLITVVEGAGVKNITFPTEVSVDVLVDIDCNEPQAVVAATAAANTAPSTTPAAAASASNAPRLALTGPSELGAVLGAFAGAAFFAGGAALLVARATKEEDES